MRIRFCAAGLVLGAASCGPSERAEPALPPGFEFVANRFEPASNGSADPSSPRTPSKRDAGACDADPREPVSISCDGERIVVRSALGFHPGRSIPPEPAKSALDRVATLLRQRQDILLVRVEGYSSTHPGSSKAVRRAQIDESQRRADAVLAYLWRRGKISAERLEAVGFGWDRRVSTSTERWPIVLRIVQREHSEVP